MEDPAPYPLALTARRPGTMACSRRTRVPWADLLQKVFAIDVLACPDCNGRMQLIAFITQATVAKRILDHLGLESTGPPVQSYRRRGSCSGTSAS